MKAEKRKQLQTNALASRMGSMVKSIKHQSPRRTVLYVVLGLGVLLGLFIAVRMWKGRQQAASDRWVQFEASDFRDIANLIKNSPETQPGIAARFQVAWYQLWNRGIKRLAGDSAKAFQSLEAAYEEYQKLAKEADGDPMYHPEALYALGVILETYAVTNREKLKEARKQYQVVAEKYPNSAFGKRARDRAKQLAPDSDSYKEISRFYANMEAFVQIHAAMPMKK